MIYIEQLELIHKSGDVLYPVKITRKSSGKTAFHLVPFGLNKTHDLLEVEDASEAIRLVIDERHSIRCSTLTATITNKKGKRIKRTGIYSIKGVNIKEYNVRYWHRAVRQFRFGSVPQMGQVTPDIINLSH